MSLFPPSGDASQPDAAAPGQVAESTEQIVGMSFDKVTRAEEVLLALSHLQQEGEIAITDAVVVAKMEDGRVHVRQTTDPTPGRAAIGGSFWGLLVGAIIGGPVLFLGAAVGAGGAALAAKLIDLGLDDRWIKEVGNWLDPGTSALLLLVGDDMRPTVVRELSRFEGRVLYCTFPEAVRRELQRALDDQHPFSPSSPSEPAAPGNATPGSTASEPG
jgi:uncharacterized membrane protein